MKRNQYPRGESPTSCLPAGYTEGLPRCAQFIFSTLKFVHPLICQRTNQRLPTSPKPPLFFSNMLSCKCGVHLSL